MGTFLLRRIGAAEIALSSCIFSGDSTSPVSLVAMVNGQFCRACTGAKTSGNSCVVSTTYYGRASLWSRSLVIEKQWVQKLVDGRKQYLRCI